MQIRLLVEMLYEVFVSPALNSCEILQLGAAGCGIRFAREKHPFNCEPFRIGLRDMGYV